MHAYEFHAAIKDGIIQVPAEYRHRVSKRVKVILLSEDPAEKKHAHELPLMAEIPYFAIDTKGYVFNRDEANER